MKKKQKKKTILKNSKIEEFFPLLWLPKMAQD